MTCSQLLKLLQDAGWAVVRQKGSHMQLKHPERAGLITLPYHGKKEIAKGTLNSILKQAGLK